MIGSGWRTAAVRSGAPASSSRRRFPARLAAVALVALVPAVAGCEAGNNAPTLQWHYPTDAGGTAVDNHLSIRNVFVLGAPLGHMLGKGQSASVFLALISDGSPDKLVSISAPGTATSVTLPKGGVPVVFGHPVLYSGPKPQVVLTGLTRALRSGSDVRLVLNFQKAGPVTLIVPVMPRAAQYATFAPPPIGVAKANAAAATVSPSSTASPSPSTTS